MKYLCLIYADETLWDRLPKTDELNMMAEYRAFGEDVKRSGHLVSGFRLRPSSAATTVRVRNGSMSTTDGPFAETKEQLGGFYLIDARDLNEAVQVAGRIPGARLGSIEVRPIWEPPAA